MGKVVIYCSSSPNSLLACLDWQVSWIYFLLNFLTNCWKEAFSKIQLAQVKDMVSFLLHPDLQLFSLEFNFWSKNGFSSEAKKELLKTCKRKQKCDIIDKGSVVLVHTFQNHVNNGNKSKIRSKNTKTCVFNLFMYVYLISIT